MRTRIKTATYLALLACALLCSISTASAEVAAYFGRASDTIKIPGYTILGSQATLEFRVLVTHNDALDTAGELYDEWTDSQVDHHAGIESGAFGAYMFPLAESISTTANFTSSWHDVAYVFNGVEQRIYVDGKLKAVQDASGSIRSGPPTVFTLGANIRPPDKPNFPGQPSFQGYLSAVRVSNIARYTSKTYVPPIGGNYTSDADTQLLYRFSTGDFGGTVHDLSGNGHDGQMGIGFAGATSPVMAQLPSSVQNVFYAPHVFQSTPNTATISWYTEIATPSTLYYGVNGTSKTATVTDSAPTTYHQLTILNLAPNQAYAIAISDPNYTSPDFSVSTENYVSAIDPSGVCICLQRNSDQSITFYVTVSSPNYFVADEQYWGTVIDGVKDEEFPDNGRPYDLGPLGLDRTSGFIYIQSFQRTFLSSKVGAPGAAVVVEAVLAPLNPSGGYGAEIISFNVKLP